MKAKKGEGEATRNTVNVTLTPRENAIVDAVMKETGMSKQELVRRVFAWFAGREDLERKIVLGIHPKGRANEALAGVLDEMARELRTRPSLPPDAPLLLNATPPKSKKPKSSQSEGSVSCTAG